MLIHKRTFSCIDIFFCVILVNFCQTAHADFDQREDKMLEERLHKIYSDHYSRPVLDSDWFKIVDAIQEQSYSVKRGDTLWGVSKIYFGDGFYWSKLWSVNESITNPHVINVGDGLKFRSGSFVSAPSLAVDRVDGEEGGPEPEGDPASPTPEPKASLSFDSSVEAYDIPDTYKDTPLNNAPAAPKVIVEARPEIKLSSHMRLTQELLNQQPSILGVVKSVGEYRMATAEAGMIVLERRAGLTEGAELAVVNSNFNYVDQGYKVKVLARVRVIRQLEGSTYEAKVIEQFDGITVDSAVIDYQVRDIDLDSNGEPINLPVKVLATSDKSFWTNGDVIFLDGKKATPNIGDLISISNQFAPNVSLYYHSGVIKIVGVSPPYATGIVIYSRTILNDRSLSSF